MTKETLAQEIDGLTTMKQKPKEWLVIQIKTVHPDGIGDDIWQEYHFYSHYTVKEWDLFAQELAGSISDWLTTQRRQNKTNERADK